MPPRLGRWLLLLPVLAYTVFSAWPYVWTAMMSLRTTDEIYRSHYALPIPADYLDAARVDGASGWRRTWHVIVPLIRPTLVNLTILDFIGKMKQFALVWVMTRGGPMWGTETVATYVVKRAFEWKTLDLGYPSAIAVLWFIIIFGLSWGLTRALQRREALEF